MLLPAHQWLLIVPGIPTGTGTGEPGDKSFQTVLAAYSACNNYANKGLFGNAGPSPEGTGLAKDIFLVRPDGKKMDAGRLFLMEKMALGFNA